MPIGFTLARNDAAGVGVASVTPVGTTLSGAPVLTAALNVCPAAAGAVAVALPSYQHGAICVQNSAGTATALTVFPPTAAGAINGGTAGAALSVPQGKSAIFIPLPTGVDYIGVVSA